jgi:DNA polymerase V
MGEPYFKIKNFCKKNNVQVFSSNYSLYGDISYRVMSIIENSWDEVEVYSIDEAFLNLSNMPTKTQFSFCHNLQKKIFKDTGIPTSIGLGATKTLAKAANFIAKKILKTPVVTVNTPSKWLEKIPIGDVWGVGHQWQNKLIARHINTAADLAVANPKIIKDTFNVVLMRTALELRGVACTTIDGNEKRQSVMSSKSFGTPQTDYNYLAEALSSHCARAYEKLRQQHLTTQRLSVFVQSNRFRQDLPQYHNAIDIKLVQATDNLCYLTHVAKFGLKKIYKEGFQYQKVGILVSNLNDKTTQQMDLFYQPSEASLIKNERLMSLFDAVNYKYGRHTLYLAAEGTTKPWSMKQQMKSPSYTTQWNDLATVTIC